MKHWLNFGKSGFVNPEKKKQKKMPLADQKLLLDMHTSNYQISYTDLMISTILYLFFEADNKNFNF